MSAPHIVDPAGLLSEAPNHASTDLTVTNSDLEYYFNVDSMSPKVDDNGRIVCVEVYGRLA